MSLSQQAIKVEWVERVNLVENFKFKLPGSQSILCGLDLGNQKLAFGFKDGTIQIVSNEGQPITTLKEHKANICTLALVRIRGQTYLASGSDIGCSKVIIWDISSWQPLDKFENHKAAVTAIVDLQDDTHILSGSYDKKINVYNVEQGRFLYNLPANQTSVTGAIINKAANRVITCGLDKSLNVWQVSRNNGKVETLFL
jgi:WD40 repeat protein